jgi:hypothetical protein
MPATEGRPVIWFEIYVSDFERAKRFYGDLFGWKFEPLTEYDAEYWTISTSEKGLGGALVKREPGAPASPSVVIYVHVDDLDHAVDEACKLGASVHRGRTLITKTAGSFVLVRDPDGNILGLWSG